MSQCVRFTLFLLLLLTTLAACNTVEGDPIRDRHPDGDSEDDDAIPDGDITDGDITGCSYGFVWDVAQGRCVPAGDGDVQDGDIEDGDATDGDVTDGDTTDGDTTDGDATDGDVSDGDLTDGDSDGLHLRVATFNVRLFYDTVCDSGDCPNDWEQLPTQAEFDERADEIAGAIRAIDADILVLEEIETIAALDALATRLNGRYPVATIGETGYDGSMDVAILATGRLLGTEGHKDEPIFEPDGEINWFTREFLEAHLLIENHTVIVFAAHFKAKRGDDPDRRWAEAHAAYKIVTEQSAETPDALIVMGGDLNDTPSSPPLQELESSGKLLRVASELPERQQATYYYNGEYQAIDHIFQAVEAAGRYETGSAHVIGDSNIGLGGSDHSALSADFIIE